MFRSRRNRRLDGNPDFLRIAHWTVNAGVHRLSVGKASRADDLHKPQILILDEATANIDTETELLIQDSLERIKNIGTMLVVAHRLSTIQHADNIIVLQNGEVLEQGNHQELLRKKGHYYKLYELQYADQEVK